jgi:hypothetical protein
VGVAVAVGIVVVGLGVGVDATLGLDGCVALSEAQLIPPPTIISTAAKMPISQ